MNKPKLLDLFCKAGGAGMGYHLAGFDVTGVDIEPQYPLTLTPISDIMTMEHKFNVKGDWNAEYWRYSPCQRYRVGYTVWLAQVHMARLYRMWQRAMGDAKEGTTTKSKMQHMQTQAPTSYKNSELWKRSLSMEGWKGCYDQRLYRIVVRQIKSILSNGWQGWICLRTSIGYGATFRQMFRTWRGSASQEQGQARQSFREFGTSFQERSCIQTSRRKLSHAGNRQSGSRKPEIARFVV